MEGLEKRVIVSHMAINRDQVIRDYCKGRIMRGEAAEVLDVSERTVQRLAKRWRRGGILALEHGLRDRTPANKLSKKLCDEIEVLLKGKYFGFNLTHFHEHLVEVEKIDVSYSSVKRIARVARITKVKRRRGKVRKRRARFSAVGYMLQADGSDHRWFGKRETCLVAAIDDASSDIPYGEFFETENLAGYMRVLRQIVERRGVPRILYVDRASFLSGISGDEQGQFYRLCDELGTRLVYAESPEAKGRIERAWGTLQDRLVSEFRLHGVDSLQSATKYLNEVFLPKTWKTKFVTKPRSAKSLYRPKPRKMELDEIFCLKFERKIRKDHTIHWDNEIFEIGANLSAPLAKYQAELRLYPSGLVRAFVGGRDLEIKRAKCMAWPKKEVKVKPQDWMGLNGIKLQEFKTVE